MPARSSSIRIIHPRSLTSLRPTLRPITPHPTPLARAINLLRGPHRRAPWRRMRKEPFRRSAIHTQVDIHVRAQTVRLRQTRHPAEIDGLARVLRRALVRDQHDGGGCRWGEGVGGRVRRAGDPPAGAAGCAWRARLTATGTGSAVEIQELRSRGGPAGSGIVAAGAFVGLAVFISAGGAGGALTVTGDGGLEEGADCGGGVG